MRGMRATGMKGVNLTMPQKIAVLEHLDGVTEAARIIAEGREEAAGINAETEREVAQIYADAHTQDPELYKFLRKLAALEASVDENTVMIVEMDQAPFDVLSGG